MALFQDLLHWKQQNIWSTEQLTEMMIRVQDLLYYTLRSSMHCYCDCYYMFHLYHSYIATSAHQEPALLSQYLHEGTEGTSVQPRRRDSIAGRSNVRTANAAFPNHIKAVCLDLTRETTFIFMNFIFMFRASWLYINKIQRDATVCRCLFIYCKITLHVSVVYSTHNQEYIKL